LIIDSILTQRRSKGIEDRVIAVIARDRVIGLCATAALLSFILLLSFRGAIKKSPVACFFHRLLIVG
jgi:hypothetical protein